MASVKFVHPKNVTLQELHARLLAAAGELNLKRERWGTQEFAPFEVTAIGPVGYNRQAFYAQFSDNDRSARRRIRRVFLGIRREVCLLRASQLPVRGDSHAS